MMAMKYFIFLYIFLMSGMAVWADDVTIPLITAVQESGANVGVENGTDERSLSFAPEASHGGPVVHVYFYNPMEDILVTVLDAGGNVVYEDTVAGSCSFTLDSQVKGELTLLLETKSALYKGSFFVE